MHQSRADERADQFHIAGGTGQELSRLCAVVIAEGEILDVCVQRIAQVVGHPLGCLGRQVSSQVGEQCSEQCCHHDASRAPSDDVHRSVSDAQVNDHLRQPRDHQTACSAQHQADECPDRFPFVAREEP